ncbi:hypothetical protein ACFFQF_02195 [Haladaptatus pallidirubidus]
MKTAFERTGATATAEITATKDALAQSVTRGFATPSLLHSPVATRLAGEPGKSGISSGEQTLRVCKSRKTDGFQVPRKTKSFAGVA